MSVSTTENRVYYENLDSKYSFLTSKLTSFLEEFMKYQRYNTFGFAGMWRMEFHLTWALVMQSTECFVILKDPTIYCSEY